jgi:cell division septum initiation protein DivIVA
MSMNSQDNGRGEKNRTLMELIEELDDLVRNAGAVPLSGGNKRVVYYDEIMEILDDMRVALPRDVIEAQKILQDREKILQDARETERRILLDAKTRHDARVSEHSSLQDARNQAGQLLAQADASAQNIVGEATEYAMRMVENLHKTTVGVIGDLEATRDELVRMSRNPYGGQEQHG